MLLAILAAFILLEPDPLPVVRVEHDNTRIDHSCILEIAPGLVIADPDHNGVIHVVASNIEIRFAPGSALRGASPETPWDTLEGLGLRVEGASNVTLRDARIHGYKVGLHATRADGLTIDAGDFSDNYRQHLRSTPIAEDPQDWLYPHRNDEVKWRDQYGSAICVESSDHVTIRDIRARRGQNGIILDRVNHASVIDNDCSFLSGWGLAMWRSSDNTISRNAFDFCVRGHVEGVYNRGQDSAGMLAFEQCSRNLFMNNSATHGGDGFFGFAGKEAIGETWLNAERERLRATGVKEPVDAAVVVPEEVAREHAPLGCNDNLFVGNDFSYAPAHGFEMTFSRGNRLIGNRLVENAICGVWGGYSNDTLFANNLFQGNGGMAYGLERGGINIEHGSGNLIVDNQFVNNRCAVHLWWDSDAGLKTLPGVVGGTRGVTGNVIAGNTMTITPDAPFPNLRKDEHLILLQLRDDGQGNVNETLFTRNTIRLDHPRAIEISAPDEILVRREGETPVWARPEINVPGRHEPVGARFHLRGRDAIIMGEWGPWDHESPLVRTLRARGATHEYEILGAKTIEIGKVPEGLTITRDDQDKKTQLRLESRSGVLAYSLPVRINTVEHRLEGMLVCAGWDVRLFPWTPETDPREHLDAWRRLADGEHAQRIALEDLTLPFATRGPRVLPGVDAAKAPWNDRFGLIATSTIPLPKGRWRFTTRSDDGVRVRANGATIIENWSWHGPTIDSGIFFQRNDEPVTIEVEYFEIDGYATLELSIEPEP